MFVKVITLKSSAKIAKCCQNLYNKSVMIVSYNGNGLHYKTTILANLALAN